MITAKEAREQLNTKLNTTLTAELAKLDKLIKEAVAADKESVSVRNISDRAKKVLEELGYTVKYYGGDPRDYEPGTYNIKF